MRITLLTAATAALLATAASAQTTDSNEAIKDRDPAMTSTSADGANSFTEAQARSRLTEAGYTQVTGLAKDDEGVWRGMASKNGKKSRVGLDYKGNVTTK